MIALNCYQNGLVSYLDVVYALSAVLAKRAATQIGGQRMGGWSRRQISKLSRRPAVEQNWPRAGAGEAGQSLVHGMRQAAERRRAVLRSTPVSACGQRPLASSRTGRC